MYFINSHFLFILYLRNNLNFGNLIQVVLPGEHGLPVYHLPCLYSKACQLL